VRQAPSFLALHAPASGGIISHSSTTPRPSVTAAVSFWRSITAISSRCLHRFPSPRGDAERASISSPQRIVPPVQHNVVDQGIPPQYWYHGIIESTLQQFFTSPQVHKASHRTAALKNPLARGQTDFTGDPAPAPPPTWPAPSPALPCGAVPGPPFTSTAWAEHPPNLSSDPNFFREGDPANDACNAPR
jgi:hypothetical protein